MSAKSILTIAGIVAVLFGLGFLLVPDTMFQIYGIAGGPTVVLGFRAFGAELLSAGLIVWFVRNSHEWATLKGVLLGLIIGNLVGMIVAAWGTATGLMNAMGWVGAAIYLVLALAFAYIIKEGPSASKAS